MRTFESGQVVAVVGGVIVVFAFIFYDKKIDKDLKNKKDK